MSIPFADLGIPAHLVEALAADGFIDAFPVQEACIPDALAGRDLCGRAATGSGKTLAFGIPLMARIARGTPHKPTGVILVPTRELAKQVQNELVSLGRATKHYILSIYGGVPYSGQVNSLRRGAGLIVACPGRLLDLVERGDLRLDAVQVVVIDEADRMADMGFLPEVSKLLDMMPTERQTMLFSATLDGEVDELIHRYQNDPIKHDLVGEVKEQPAEQRWERVPMDRRIERAVELIREFGPTMMFSHTRDGADQLVEDLEDAGLRARGIHGGLNQTRRERALDAFKAGKVEVLVGTDVAARGIHVDGVQLILQWDLPSNAKDYVHRSGRTARAGATGVIINMVAPHQEKKAKWLMSRVDPGSKLAGDAVASEGRSSRGPRPPRRERDERPRRDNGYEARPVRNDFPGASRDGGHQPREARTEQPASREGGWQPREARTERPANRDSGWQPREARTEHSPYGARSSSGPKKDNRASRRAGLQSGNTGDRATGHDARADIPNDGQPRKFSSDGVIDWHPRDRKAGEFGPAGARRSFNTNGPAGAGSRRTGGRAGTPTSVRAIRSGFSRPR